MPRAYRMETPSYCSSGDAYARLSAHTFFGETTKRSNSKRCNVSKRNYANYERSGGMQKRQRAPGMSPLKSSRICWPLRTESQRYRWRITWTSATGHAENRRYLRSGFRYWKSISRERHDIYETHLGLCESSCWKLCSRTQFALSQRRCPISTIGFARGIRGFKFLPI